MSEVLAKYPKYQNLVLRGKVLEIYKNKIGRTLVKLECGQITAYHYEQYVSHITVLCA